MTGLNRLEQRQPTGGTRRPRLMEAAVLCFLLGLGAASVATADEGIALERGWELTVGPVAGALVFDRHLADYRWDTHPSAQAGLQATVERGRLAAGTRVWRAQTTQASGIPGESQSPRVNLTGIDLIAQVRVVRYRRLELSGVGSAGVLHLGYDPDRLTFDPGGLSEPITVNFDPISEWQFGLGIVLRGNLTRQLALAVQAEQSTFALDTAHRRGSEIVFDRERFYSWSFWLQVSWTLGLG